MSTGPAPRAKILLVDSNVFFATRLSDALTREGFEVVTTQNAAYALTMLERFHPNALMCAMDLREMPAQEVARILRADPSTASLQIIAIGSGRDVSLMELYSAGCDDYVDRREPIAETTAQIRTLLLSRQESFQPSQMIPAAETAMSGKLSQFNLPGVIQILTQARQTGALHVNAGATDGVIFFSAGEIVHAECGPHFGDEAVVELVKICEQVADGEYKFTYGTTTPHHSVLRSSMDLLLDAMRELDESRRHVLEKELP